MPISSLVLHLAADADRTADLERTLRDDPRVTLGSREGARLPIVLDTADRAETHAIFETIASHSGARHVDVVFVEVDEDESADFPESSDLPEGAR